MSAYWAVQIIAEFNGISARSNAFLPTIVPLIAGWLRRKILSINTPKTLVHFSLFDCVLCFRVLHLLRILDLRRLCLFELFCNLMRLLSNLNKRYTIL